MKKPLIYLIPLFILISLITYRNYQFYLREPWQIFKQIKPNLAIDQYGAVQQNHPYYEIFKLAEEYRNKSDYKVIYFSNKTGAKYIDYNSSLYATLRSKDGKPVEKYLSAVGLMINYFFYPRIIPITYSYFEVRDLINSSGERKVIVISDIDLKLKPYNFPNLKRLVNQDIDNRKVYRPVEPFFIFKKI
jgi:hypothetical protein